ncbi:MAG: hypothetical protein ACRCYE_11520 [Sarcina sp.]
MIYVLTIIAKQILATGVLVFFMWALMLIIPNRLDMSLRHFILNFMPYNMVKFQEYYSTNEVYIIGSYNLQRIEFIFIVSAFLIIVLISISILLYKQQNKRRYLNSSSKYI